VIDLGNSSKAILVLALVIWLSIPAQADWINLTGAENAPNIAEIYIHDDRVQVNLEIYINDFATFAGLMPDELFKDMDIKLPPFAERLRRFSEEDLQFVTEEGKNLQAELKLIEPRLREDRPSPFVGMINPITRRRVPGPPEDKRVFYAELIYPFSKKPHTLAIIPPIDIKNNVTASIGFVVYHKDVPVVDFKYLAGPLKMHLDWEDPWYSRFEKKAYNRWQQSGVMTFVYIEPYEVRHETLARVKDLEQWIDLGLRGDEFIEIDEFEPLKKKIGEFLLGHSNVLIDGKRLRPILDRTAFVKYTMTRTFFLSQAERIPLSTAMVGVIVTYLTDGIPQEVKVDWDLFSDKIQKVPANAVDPVGPFPSYVTPDDNILVWTNYLKNYKIPTVAEVAVPDSMMRFYLPVGSILCLGAILPVAVQIGRRKRNAKSIVLQCGLLAVLLGGSLLLYPHLQITVGRPAILVAKPADDEAVPLLHSLLKNVYRAFNFREEDDVYDKLALSVSGDLLTDIYLQNRKSLEIQRAGGAQAKVKEVEILDVSVGEVAGRPLALAFTSNWTAFGTVGHWGHIHARKNQYEAIITVEPVDGVWKITDLELLDETRIDPYATPKT
jgi:hypothetical protein